MKAFIPTTKNLLITGLLMVTSFMAMGQFSDDDVVVTIDKHVSCPDGDDAQITVTISNMAEGELYVVQWRRSDDSDIYDNQSIYGTATGTSTVIFPTQGAKHIPIKSGNIIVVVLEFSTGIFALNSTANILEPDPLVFNTTQPTCAVNTGTIEIDSPIDDKGVYSFEYSVDGGTTYQASPLFEGLSNAAYNIRVKIISHTNCFLTDVGSINPPPTPLEEPTLDVTQPTCAEPTGTIEVLSPTGIDLEYARNIMGPWQDATTFSGLPADNIYTIFVRRKSDNTCLNSKSVSINPAPSTPAAPTATTSDATCAGGGTVEVTSPLGAGYEYSIDGANYQASTTFSDVAPGDYDVTVRLVVDPLCISAPTTVTVNAAAGVPVIDNTSHTDPTTLGGSEGTITVNLVASSGTPNYIYYLTDNLNTPVANSPATAAETYEFTGLSAGNYTVYVIDNASCTSASVTGIILEDPVGCTDAEITLTSANDNQTVCQDESIADIVYSIAGDFGAVNVAGLPNGVSGSLVGATYTISGTPTEFGTFNYTVTVDGSGGCLGDNASGTINVTEPTVPTFTQLGPYCLGDAADALPGTSTNGITGSWSPATISTATSGTTVYNFTPDAGQCAAPTSMSVSVNEAPQNVDAGPDVSICEGENTQLQGSADLPSNNNVLLSQDFTGVSVFGLPAGWSRSNSLWGGMNTSYAGGSAPELSLLSDGSTNNDVYRVVTPLINAIDNQFLDLNFIHTVNHFNGAYRVAVQTSTDGVNWTNRWEFFWPGASGGDIPPESVNVDLSVMDDESFYIAFTYTGRLFNINYWAIDNVELTGLFAEPVSVLWTPSTGLSDPTILKPIASPTETTTYTLTIGIGGCENSDQVTVTVVDNVIPTFSLDPEYTYCEGDSPVILPETSDNGISGTWSPSVISTETIGLTTYTFTPNPGECAYETSIDVLVKELPMATMSGGGDYCDGADPTGVDVQIDLTGEGPWLVRIDVDGDERDIVALSTPHIISNVGEGHFTMISVQDANCIGTVSGEAFVIEIPAPTAAISGGGDYCAGTTPTGVNVAIDLTGTAPWSLVYAIDGVDQPAVTDINASPYTIANATAGEYTLTSVADASCDGTVSGLATVVENPLPTAEISGGGSYCAGVDPTGIDLTVALTGSSPWTIVYAIDGVDQAAITGIATSPYIIEDATAGEYTLTLVEDATGCSGIVIGSAEVMENPLPTAEISGGGSYCAGTDPTGVDVTIDLTGEGPWTVVYAINGTSQPALVDIPTTPYVLTDATAGDYTLVSVVDANCTGTVSGLAQVVENPLPTAEISGGGSYCAGVDPTGIDLTVALTGSSPWTIVYAIDGVDQPAVTGIATSPYTIANATAGEYTITSVEDATGCSGTGIGSATVIEHELPHAIMSGGGSYCAGADPTGVDVQIDLTGEGPWLVRIAVDGDERDILASATPHIINDVGEGHFTIISVTDANCAGTVEGEAFVIELPLPEATISGGGEYCAGTDPTGIDVQINFSGIGPWDVTYAIDGVDQPEITGITTSPYTISNATAGVYTLTSVSDENCDGTVSGSVAVIENSLPTAEISGGGSYCAGTDPTGINLTIDLTGVGPWTMVYAINGASQPALIDIPASPYVLTDVTEGNYTLVSVSDVNCIGTVSGLAEVVENQLPTAEISGGGNYCAGTIPTGVDVTIDLTGEGPWTVVYAIDGISQPELIDILTSPYILADATEGEYTLVSVVDANCIGTVNGNATVVENPLPTATMSGGGSYCAGTDPTNVDVSIELTGTGPWTVIYAVDGVPNVVSGIDATPYVISDATKGEYTMIGVEDAFCSGTVSGSASVIEFEIPTALMSGGGEYCKGADPTGVDVRIDFTGTAPWSYTFSADGDVRTLFTLTSPVIFNDVGEGYFVMLDVTDANCTGTVSGDALVVEIETAPPTGDTNQEFCAGATIADIVVTGESISWYDAPGGSILADDYMLVDGETYYATQTADGCESQDNLAVTVTVYEQLNLSIVDVKHGRCDNPNAGSIEVQASGGNLPYTYTLYDELDNPIGVPIEATTTDPVTFTDLESGTYYVIADDNSVCNQIISADIVVNEAIPVLITEIDLTNNHCFGDTNAEVIITATGGGGDLTYWFEDSDGVLIYGPQVNDAVFTGLADGDYTIVVEGENGCVDTYDIEIAGPNELGLETELTSITCSDDGNVGLIRARATGGTAPFTISLLLDGVEQAQFTNIGYNTWVEFTNLAPDNRYEVVVNDRWSCGPVTSGLLEITIPDPLLIAVPVVQNVTCFGQSNGEVGVSASGGVGPYTFKLFDENDAELASLTDASEVTFTNLLAGYNFYITVVDANGCEPEATSVFDIDEPDPIAIDINSIIVSNITCNGAGDGQISLSASGGTGDLYFTLTTGGIAVGAVQVGSGVFTNLAAGDYVVEITDDLSCGPVYSDVLTISEPDVLNLSITSTNPLCSGDVGEIALTVTNGVEPYTISLVKDGAEIETTTANAAQEVVFTSLDGGIYTVNVEDFNGCSVSSADIDINDEVDPIVVTPVVTHPTCDPFVDPTSGTIDVSVESGGTAPYTFTLYDASGTVVETAIDNASVQFIDLNNGTYNIEVVDVNGCTIPMVEVILNPATTLSIDDVISKDISCFGQSDGEIEVVISGETGTPEFRITPGDDVWQTENVFTGLGLDAYTIDVSDENGCIVTWGVDIEIGQPAEPFAISLAGTLPTSISTSDGRIDITPSGGTPPYEFTLEIEEDGTWTTVATSELPVFDNLPVGEYKVIGNDANGCIDEETITLTQYSFTLSATDALCFGSEDGTITVTEVYGVTDPLSIVERQWTDGYGNNISDYMVEKYNEDEGLYKELPAGTYTLFAVTAQGADYTASITIGQPEILDVDHIVAPIVCFTTDAVGEVTFTITGGTPFADGFYNISWQDGETLIPRDNVVGGLLEGTYTFTITDANGCEYTEDVTVDYPEPISISSLHVYNVNCFGDNTGEISVWATGNSALTYRIEGALPEGYENENSNGIFSNLPAGAYELFITDADGCEHIFTDGNRFVIEQPDPIEITTLTADISERTCHTDTVGVNEDGIIYMQVSGGVPDYTYQWTNNWETYNKQTLNLEYPTPGTYQITVTDRNNCLATKEVIVPGPAPINITFAYDTADCKVFGDGVALNGGINLTAITGGNSESDSDYGVKWYRASDEYLADYDNNWKLVGRQAAGFYTIVTDKLGCEEKMEFTIPHDENNRFDVLIDMDKDNYCFNDQVSLRAVVETENSIGDPTYKWINITDSPDQIFNRVENLYTTQPLKHTALFRVDVISGIGCVESAEATVSVYPRIGPFVDRDLHPFFADSDLDAFRVNPEDPASDGDSTVISVLANTEYPIEMYTKNPDYTLTFSWSPAEFFNPTNEKATAMMFTTGTYENFMTGQIENVITGKKEEYIPIVGLAQSEYGCIEKVNLKARILDEVNTSNVFTPNGDGINDLWSIPYSDIFPNLEIKIHNRWGYMVWSAKGSEAARGWDGKNKNGKDMPFGTYYYVIKFNVDGTEKWKPVSGSVTILR